MVRKERATPAVCMSQGVGPAPPPDVKPPAEDCSSAFVWMEDKRTLVWLALRELESHPDFPEKREQGLRVEAVNLPHIFNT